jgi:hypothetical protein
MHDQSQSLQRSLEKTMDFLSFGQTNIMDNSGVLGMALDHFSRLLFIG